MACGKCNSALDFFAFIFSRRENVWKWISPIQKFLRRIFTMRWNISLSLSQLEMARESRDTEKNHGNERERRAATERKRNTVGRDNIQDSPIHIQIN